MQNMIKNNENKEIFLDFSFMQNVRFKENHSSLDEIIEKLEIQNVKTYQEFLSFLRNSIMKQGFICLVNDTTRKVNSKSNEDYVYDAIIRMELNTTSQEKLPKETYLGFFVNINPKAPVLTITSIFQTRLSNKAQDFETTIDEASIELIKYKNQFQTDELLRRNLLNSSTIENIGVLVSKFIETKNKWSNYLNFLTDLLSVQRKVALPFLNLSWSRVVKVEKKEFTEDLNSFIVSKTKNKNYFYLSLDSMTLLENKNIYFDVVDLITIDLLTNNLDKVNNFKVMESLALIPLVNNRVLPSLSEFQRDPEVLFDFELDKNKDSKEILSLSELVAIDEKQINFVSYWEEKQNIFLGTRKDLKSILTKHANKLSEWFVLKVTFETDYFIETTNINEKNIIDTYKTGYLVYSGVGEEVLIERSKQVLKRIAEGNTKNPYLINYLFNTKLLELTESTNLQELEEYKYELNQEQKEAVNKALNSKDVFILQGPPGTGKTQVICEIIYQLSQKNRKVLISSQNHEAIKNVVDRLPYEPNVNRLRLTNRLNTSSKAQNNFSPERVVYNYYKSIANSVFEYLRTESFSIEEFNNTIMELEKLINNSKGFHQLNNSIRALDIEITTMKSNVQTFKSKRNDLFRKKDKLKDELLNLKNFIELLSTKDFSMAIVISDKLKSLYEMKYQNLFDDFKWNNSLSFMISENFVRTLENICEEVLFSNDIYKEITALKRDIYQNKKMGNLENVLKLESQISILEKTLDEVSLIKEFNNFLFFLSKDLDFLKTDLEHELYEVEYSLADDSIINNQEVEINNLEVKLQKLYKSRTENNKELTSLLKKINNKFNLNLDLKNIDLEEILREELNSFSSELEAKQSKREELNEFYSLITSYLKDNYKIEDDFDSEVATNNFTVQMIQESKKYMPTLIKNIINVYAMTLTSSNLFKFNKNEQANKLGLEEISLKSIDVDVVIIDEASKATLLEILMPLIYGKTLILVGDYKQLPPIFKLQPSDVKTVNEQLGKDYDYYELMELLNQSAFKNLVGVNKKEITTLLRTQYRSHRKIMDIVNKFYDGFLKVEQNVSDQKEHNLIVLGNKNKEIINQNSSVYWIDSTYDENDEIFFEQREDNSTSIYNDLEVEITMNMVSKLNESVKNLSLDKKPTLAIISFYGLHVKKIKNKLRNHKFKNIEIVVNTVDDFQGKEADYVIVNIVRNPAKLSSKSGREFLKKYERINVAFSRARELLIIVGSKRAVNDITVKIPKTSDPNIINTHEIYSSIIDKIEYDGSFLTLKDI